MRVHTTGKGCRCKHIAAIEHVLLVSTEAATGKKIKIEKTELKCPGCKGTEFTCDGWHYGKHEKRQRYRCSNTTCKRGFRDNLGFEYRQVPKMLITLALPFHGMGLAPANIQLVLKMHREVKVHEDTVTRILEPVVQKVIAFWVLLHYRVMGIYLARMCDINTLACLTIFTSWCFLGSCL